MSRCEVSPFGIHALVATGRMDIESSPVTGVTIANSITQGAATSANKITQAGVTSANRITASGNQNWGSQFSRAGVIIASFVTTSRE